MVVHHFYVEMYAKKKKKRPVNSSPNGFYTQFVQVQLQRVLLSPFLLGVWNVPVFFQQCLILALLVNFPKSGNREQEPLQIEPSSD